MLQRSLGAAFGEGTRVPAISPPFAGPDLKRIFEQTSSLTDFSTLLDALHSGPKLRGQDRNQFTFSDSSRGDVYRCVLLALTRDPPVLAFNYDEIYQRTRSVCVGEGGAPIGSSVAQALEQMHKLAEAVQPTARVIEWSEDVLDMVDPYFLYYLRCSSRLQAVQRR